MWFSEFASQNPTGPTGPAAPAGKGPKGPPPQQAKPADQKAPQGPDGEEDEDWEEDEEGPGAFARLMASLGPWAVSAITHLALIIVAILIVWSVKTTLEEEKVIIPDATFSENPGAPLTVQTTETKMQTMARKSLVKATNSSTPSKLVKNTSSISFSGGGMASGNPFGATLGTGQGPFANKFMGMGGNASKIAYMIDASGSLIDTLPFVISELKRSISKLSDQQSFTVVFFQGNKVIEWNTGGGKAKGLRPASQENKQKASIWIDPQSGNVVPMGESNPINAIKTVLAYKPELLYILSDNITGTGRWEIRQADLINAYTRANIGRTKVNAIQFLYEDPLVHLKDPKTGQNMKPTLQMIADLSGGRFKFVSAGELGVDLP